MARRSTSREPDTLAKRTDVLPPAEESTTGPGTLQIQVGGVPAATPAVTKKPVKTQEERLAFEYYLSLGSKGRSLKKVAVFVRVDERTVHVWSIQGRWAEIAVRIDDIQDKRFAIRKEIEVIHKVMDDMKRPAEGRPEGEIDPARVSADKAKKYSEAILNLVRADKELAEDQRDLLGGSEDGSGPSSKGGGGNIVYFNIQGYNAPPARTN